MHMLKTIKKLVKICCQPAHEMKQEEDGGNCTMWPCVVMVTVGWKMTVGPLGLPLPSGQSGC